MDVFGGPSGQTVLGAIPAIAVGLLMAMLKPVRIFFDPLIACLFPIPKVALMPLLLLAFGFGDASKIALVAIAVFFPVCVNTYTGASNIERIYWDVARNYGATIILCTATQPALAGPLWWPRR